DANSSEAAQWSSNQESPAFKHGECQWKVYANEEETRALFDRYAHCTEDFCSRLEQGCSFPDLVRAV
ncbi:MAG: DUF3793 family protein, partial [Mitsuokella multacida]|nr:DUF3793 family protein [Mitsuokella multacida]